MAGWRGAHLRVARRAARTAQGISIIVADSRVGHDALRAAFADGYRPFARQGQIARVAARSACSAWCTRPAAFRSTSLFAGPERGRWRGLFGAPDHLVFDTPAFSIVEEVCAGMQVPLLPQPLDEYPQWIYGDDRAPPYPDGGRHPGAPEFIQKGFVQPGDRIGERSAALNRALLSLLTALHEGQMRSAAALCHQILAVEQQDAVRRCKHGCRAV